MIEHIFPIPFYKTNVPCPKKEWDGMMEVCEKFYNRNLDEINSCGNLTGDQDIPEFFLLHTSKKFYWLNYHMGQAVRDYLSQITVLDDDGNDPDYSVFFQKSWPNVTRLQKGGNPDHLHKGSHLSGVYYLRTAGTGGNITLINSNEMDMLPLNLKEHLGIYEFYPKDGDLIVFPSSIMHRVVDFNGPEFRASIVFDIFITSTETVDERYENVVTSPHYWVRV